MALASGPGAEAVSGDRAWLVGTSRVVWLWELAEGDGQWASTVLPLGGKWFTTVPCRTPATPQPGRDVAPVRQGPFVA